jgi:hypothetical protein
LKVALNHFQNQFLLSDPQEVELEKMPLVWAAAKAHLRYFGTLASISVSWGQGIQTQEPL